MEVRKIIQKSLLIHTFYDYQNFLLHMVAILTMHFVLGFSTQIRHRKSVEMIHGSVELGE
jgi:hypothetical protein